MRKWLPRCRIFSNKTMVIFIIVLGFGVFCYYYSLSTTPEPSTAILNPVNKANEMDHNPPSKHFRKPIRQDEANLDQCALLKESTADIDTVAIYPAFEFKPSLLRENIFWDKSFENRYEKIKKDTHRPSLKVFLVPHSHNDPGWLKTFEQYFREQSKKILDNVVSKLNEHRNMTFIWTEMSFLNAWWESARHLQKKAMKKLIKEGRLEITTGGWVMPDEACTHIYALIDQFIEGHNWVKTNLGIFPKTGWSIDPFGHGPTVAYLLDQSGLEGAVIQRIHYAWKQWLAQRQIEDFYWIPGWSANKPDLIVHNQPFDMYSIKSSCGPHPSVCLSFDFKFNNINYHDVQNKSKILVDEYKRIGSLTPHNVILVPLGDDFRYDHASEFDDQYINYMKLFNYINSHKEQFNADVQFGTPLDYFNAVKERQLKIPTLKGDFFVYSDIFNEGRPAYWSGYYTTRPYIKILARQLEHHLRTSEILFTLISNYIKQSSNKEFNTSQKRLENFYEQLIIARRNLGLFQHHDAITGTSKDNVMTDYGTKLFTSLYHCMRLQEAALATIMLPDTTIHNQNVVQSQIERADYGKSAEIKLQVSLIDRKKVILFNPLAEQRTEVITLTSNTTNIRVYDTRQHEYVLYQITPYIDVLQDGKRVISETKFEILFVATVPALSSVTFNLEEYTNHSHHCEVFCVNCQKTLKKGETPSFVTNKMMPGDIQLENSELTLLVNRNKGFLRQIFRKAIKKKNVVEMRFGAYQSDPRQSGVYLFMPDYNAPEKSVLLPYSKWRNEDDNIIIVSGPVTTDVTTMYLPFLIHTIRIFNIEDPVLSRAVLIENIVDFGDPPTNRETELFMRIQTDIQNGEPPEFYTDQNGFQYQKRVKIEKLGIEANVYPITTMAWLQDEETRLTLITDHAQGASAFQPGLLEVMMDRRSLYDDFRGLGEGIVDNKRTVFRNWLLLESMVEERPKRDTSEKGFKHVSERHFNPNQKDSVYAMPSQMADYLSRTMNYPVNVYLVDTSEVGEVEVKSSQAFVQEFPAGIHLLTLRTISDEVLEQTPSSQSYMVLQRAGVDCRVGAVRLERPAAFSARTHFPGLRIRNLTAVSLTGLKTYESLDGLQDIQLGPMEVRTFKIRF